MKRVLIAALALSAITGSVAMADSWNDHGRNDHRSSDSRRHDDRRDNDRRHDGNKHDDRRNDHGRRDDHRYNDHRNDRHHDGWRNDRHDYRHDHRPSPHSRFHGPVYHRPHGYRAHYWRRGEYLPPAYRGRGYIVSNYGAYRLRHPPRGHHWVRVNNDVLLTAIATGVVVDVAYNLFY